MIKVLLYIVIVPLIFSYIVSSPFITLIFRLIYLILTYGYLFFLNTDIMVSTRKIIVWKEKKLQGTNFQLDKIQKIEVFTKLSGKIKSFVFLVFYYLPIFIVETQLLLGVPYLGRLVLIVLESFFNGAFYFLQNWPYDVFNVGFIEKNFPYMFGYGFVISVICNYFLEGIYATAAYLIISLWMLINTIVFSPPEAKFNNLNDVVEILFKKYKQRKFLKNQYNKHRERIRQDSIYRKSLVKGINLLYPALKITEVLNQKMSSSKKEQKQNIKLKEQHSNKQKQKLMEKERQKTNSISHQNENLQKIQKMKKQQNLRTGSIILQENQDEY